jgi:hypothetical protein
MKEFAYAYSLRSSLLGKIHLKNTFETANILAHKDTLNDRYRPLMPRNGMIMLRRQYRRLSICLSVHPSTHLEPFIGLWPLFSFLILYTVSRTPWTGDQPVARPLPTHRTTQKNKRTQTSMPRVGFEPTIPVFERSKTVHALDSAVTVIGYLRLYIFEYCDD